MLSSSPLSAHSSDFAETDCDVEPAPLSVLCVARRVTLVHPIEAKGHKIDSISFTYRYLSGYGAEGPPSSWPVLSAELVSSGTKEVLRELYTSPPLDKYKFDSGMPCVATPARCVCATLSASISPFLCCITED